MGMQKGHPAERAHPAISFVVTTLLLFLVLEASALQLRGGVSQWGEAVLVYRASALLNDVVLAGGAYFIVRRVFGSCWWLSPRFACWGGFIALCAGGGVFLLVLSRRLAAHYGPIAPPMTTGWEVALLRAVLPVLALLLVRWRYTLLLERSPA